MKRRNSELLLITINGGLLEKRELQRRDQRRMSELDGGGCIGKADLDGRKRLQLVEVVAGSCSQPAALQVSFLPGRFVLRMSRGRVVTCQTVCGFALNRVGRVPGSPPTLRSRSSNQSNQSNHLKSNHQVWIPRFGWMEPILASISQ